MNDVEIVWPTVELVRKGVNGYAAGESIPCESKTLRARIPGFKWEEDSNTPPTDLNYKENIKQCLRKWLPATDYKSRVSPHLKTFYRYFIAEDGEVELLWLYMGSANLSMAAWGTLINDDNTLHIKSYELGVLFLPSKIRKTTRTFSLTPSNAKLGLSSPATLPQSSTPPRFIVSHKPSPQDKSSVHFPLPHQVLAPRYEWHHQGDLENMPWCRDLVLLKKDCLGKSNAHQKYFFDF